LRYAFTTSAADADGFGLLPAIGLPAIGLPAIGLPAIGLPAMGAGCSGAGASGPGRVRRAEAAGVAGVCGLLPVRALLRVLVCVLFTAIGTRYPVRGG